MDVIVQNIIHVLMPELRCLRAMLRWLLLAADDAGPLRRYN